MAIQMTRAEYQAKYGVQPSGITAQPVSMTREQYNAKYGKKEPSSFSERVKADYAERGTKATEIVKRQAAGKQRLPDSVLQFLGQGAGLIGDIGFEAVKSATPDFIEKKVGDVVSSGVSKAVSTPVGQSIINKSTQFSQENPRLSANIGAVANLATVLPIAEGAGLAAKGAIKTAKTTSKAALKTAEAVGSGSSKVAKFGTSQVTGLSPKTIEQIISTPEKFAKEAPKVTRTNLGGKVKDTIDAQIENLSETGKGYEKLRKASQAVTIPEKTIPDTLSKYGINFNKDGKIIRTAETVPLKPGDIADLEDFVQLYGTQGTLSPNAFLNARKSLSNLAEYGATKSDVSNKIAKDLRSEFDKLGKKQIPGLSELDAKYAPAIRSLKELKKDYFTPEGQLKDTALSKIANLTNNGKEKVLERLEKVIPNVREQVNILKALEDIELAKGQKVGTYARGATSGFVLSGGNPFAAILSAVAASPEVAVPILRGYGNTKKLLKSKINPLINKMKSGTKLNRPERQLVKDALIQQSKIYNKKNALGVTGLGILGAKGVQQDSPTSSPQLGQ